MEEIIPRRRRKRDRWRKGGWTIERNETSQRRTKRQKYIRNETSSLVDVEMGEAGHSICYGRVGRLPVNRPLMKMTVSLLGTYQTIGGSVMPTVLTTDDDGKMLYCSPSFCTCCSICIFSNFHFFV